MSGATLNGTALKETVLHGAGLEPPSQLTLRQWLIILTASIGALLEIIDVSITNVALIQIQANLGASLAEVGWVVTGYAMASVIMIPLSEWLGELFGQRNYFVFAKFLSVAMTFNDFRNATLRRRARMRHHPPMCPARPV